MKIFEVAFQIAEIVGEILSHLEKNELTSATFLIIPLKS